MFVLFTFNVILKFGIDIKAKKVELSKGECYLKLKEMRILHEMV